MKKLTEEEFNRTDLVWHGKTSLFYRSIISLKKGEGLFISKSEWNMYKTPGRICRYIEKNIPE